MSVVTKVRYIHFQYLSIRFPSLLPSLLSIVFLLLLLPLLLLLCVCFLWNPPYGMRFCDASDSSLCYLDTRSRWLQQSHLLLPSLLAIRPCCLSSPCSPQRLPSRQRPRHKTSPSFRYPSGHQVVCPNRPQRLASQTSTTPMQCFAIAIRYNHANLLARTLLPTSVRFLLSPLSPREKKEKKNPPKTTQTAQTTEFPMLPNSIQRKLNYDYSC